MRCFLVSFTNGKRFGNCFVETPNYPSLDRIKLIAKDMRMRKNIVVLSIIEFKTKRDYLEFKK